MWPRLIAGKYAELWVLHHHWVTRFNPVQWWEHPLQANLQGQPGALSAPSRCFTLTSLTLWAHGTGMDRAEQPAGSFPNHCALIRWSKECSCSKQTMSDTVPVQAVHWAQGGQAATASLGKGDSHVQEEKVTKFFGHESQKLFSNHWTEIGAFSAKKEVPQTYKAGEGRGREGQQENRNDQGCFNCRCPNCWAEGGREGKENPPPQGHF